MKLTPYDLPRLPGFRTRSFRRSAERWRPVVEAALLRKTGRTRFDVWTGVPPQGGAQLTAQAPLWLHKIYVCLDARSYWPCLARLLKSRKTSPLMWKFYSEGSRYDRPDKIVFYARSERALREGVRRLRTLVRGRGFHALRHAGRSDELGLEKRGSQGLWIGSDPIFLGPGASWRVYRCLCSAWAGLNREYLEALPGGAARWHERMNLSTAHEGPRSLRPDPRDAGYVRRYWRLIRPG